VDGLDIIPDRLQGQYGSPDFDPSTVPDSVLAAAVRADEQNKKCLIM